MSNHRKIVYYYLAIVSALLIFLKLLASDFFKEAVNFAITFLPFGIIFFLSLYSFYLYQKHPERKDQITKHTLVTILQMLFVTLIFYVLYSPSSFAPVLESFVNFQRRIKIDTYFFILACVSVLMIAFSTIFFFYRLYQKSAGKYFGSINLLLKHSLETVFVILFVLMGTSVLAYPNAYNPITDFVSDAIYTVSFGRVDLGNPDLTNSRRITSLKRLTDSLSQTYANLANSVSGTSKDLATTIAETKEKLDSSIIRTNKDLKNTLTNDITDRLDTGGGTVDGKLVVEKTLTVNSISNLQDIIPQADDTYDLGSVSKGWDNVYVHRLIGSSIITVGDGSTSHSLTSTDALLVSGNLEANSLVYLDAGADLGSQNIINLADPVNAQDAATKAYVDSQVVAVSYIQRNVGTETLYPLNTGDKLDMLGSTILNIGNAGTDFIADTGGLTLAGTLTVGSLNGILKGTAGIVSAATGGSDYEYPLTFSNSLSRSTNTVTLVNDSATPGVSKYYGTDSGGTKGYFDFTAGVTAHSALTNLTYATAGHSGFEPTVTKGNLTAGSTKISIGGTGTNALIGAGATVDVAEANLTHNNLGSLQGGTTNQYYHLTSAQSSALHSEASISDSSSINFTLSGQEISGSVLPAGVDHNSLANLTTGDYHTQYALLAGRSGGQILYGGTLTGNTLTVQGNSVDTGTAMTIASNGYLAIGSASIATGNTVTIQDSNGSCTLDPGSGASWACTSDKTLKKDIAPLGGSLSSILKLKPSTFKMIVDNSNGVGFIAQEVAEALPDAVSMMPNGTLGVAEGKFIPYLVGSIQDQQTQIAGKESAIIVGTAGQYWTGEKTWATLDKNAIGLGNVENTKLSTWAGTSNITTLGTITSGTWNGANIAVANGGTGASTADGARLNLGAATSGVNSDIISLTATTSVASSGSLALSAGGTNQNIALTPSGMGNVVIQAGLSDQSTAIPSTLIQFNDGSGIAVGSITFASNATSYNTFSDVRLKENITGTDLTVADLMKINIRDFTWKSDPEHQITHGVIAQELATVYPAAVTIPNGKDKFWMVDYSKLTPLIVKSIQDQQAILETHNTQLETQKTEISQLNLKTDENITTLAGLKASVDSQFLIISGTLNNQNETNDDQDDEISDLKSQIADSNLQIAGIESTVNSQQLLVDNLNALATTIQSQIDELKKLTNQDLNLAQLELNTANIESNTQDIALIKQILGITDADTEGNVSILGILSAEKVVVDGIETGAITIVVNDKDKKTIGDATITVAGTVDSDENISDGKNIIIKTTAVTDNSKIYLTPLKSTNNQVMYVGKIKSKESFEVKVDDVVKEDIRFNWWIVEEK